MANVWSLDDQKTLDSELLAYEWNRLVRASSASVQGALRTLGSGVADGLEPTLNGGQVEVSAGRGIAESTEFGFFPLDSGGVEQIALPADDGTYFLLLDSTFAFEPYAPDSRESGLGTLRWEDDDDVDGAITLAGITIEGGFVTNFADQRQLINIAALLNRIEILEADLGYDAVARAKGSVDERINALGAGEDETGQPVSEVTLAMFNALKATVTALAAEIAALKAQSGLDAPLTLRMAGRVENLRAEHSRLALSTTRELPRTGQRLDSSIIVGGVAGDDELLPDGTHQKAVYLGGSLKIDARNRRVS